MLTAAYVVSAAAADELAYGSGPRTTVQQCG